MKLKLDLHPIYSDSRRIEAELSAIIDEACEKRASEIEIIPGKGSGALKKSVLRFLDRPEVKARYHRIEKDSDNWGRLFVHFRWERQQSTKPTHVPELSARAACFCCGAAMLVAYDDDDQVAALVVIRDCPGCASPNRITLRRDRARIVADAGPGYDET